jgi:hypothetical protein
MDHRHFLFCSLCSSRQTTFLLNLKPKRRSQAAALQQAVLFLAQLRHYPHYKGMRFQFAVCGFAAVLTTTSNNFVSAFSSSPVPKWIDQHHSSLHRLLGLSSVAKNEESASSPSQRTQELEMERSSRAGADAIAKLNAQERAKRALLAEAIENRIFELVDELELLIKRTGVESFAEFPNDLRDIALDLAKRTKELQSQYDDLVNGRPSLLLMERASESVNDSFIADSSYE